MTAPERIYLTTNKSDGEWSNVSQRTVPDWLSKHVDEHQYIRTDIHEAEIGALKTELAALKEWRYSDQELAIKILSYLGFSQESSKEPYADRRRDHIAEMICQNCEPLKTELAALKAPPKGLSAEDVEEEGWYWSVDNEEFVQIECEPTILPWRLSMWRVGSSTCSRLQGQFIGPLQMPEV